MSNNILLPLCHPSATTINCLLINSLQWLVAGGSKRLEIHAYRSKEATCMQGIEVVVADVGQAPVTAQLGIEMVVLKTTTQSQTCLPTQEG